MKWKLKKFKELTGEDMYEILKVRAEVFVVEQECPYQDPDAKDQNAYHLFAQEDDKIIAYLRILEKGISYDEISIGRVLISKDHRGKRLSRKLMLKAIDFIENDMKEKKIKISAQAYLLEFYRSLGFKEVSNVYLEDNIPHIDMLYNKNM